MPIAEFVFLTGFTVGCALAVMRNPIYGVITYIGTLYMDPAGQWWGQGFLLEVRWEMIAATVALLAMLIHPRKDPSPVFRSGMFWGFIVYVAWIIVQFLWAIDPVSHGQLLGIWSKFLLVCIMICGCVDSWKDFRLVLWSHALGCAYMGWLAHGMYHGGRFEGFGLSSISEANAAALQLVTGLAIAGSLFLDGSWRTKLALILPIAMIADGLVATESRSGFLAALAAGLAFNWFTPRPLKARVIGVSLLGVLGFLALTTSNYWNRIDTIKYEGEHVQGVDTGHSRVVIFEAQLKMFREHPFGCGSQCTEALSPKYIPPQYMAKGLGRRASHNTPMTMLVDHGIPGGILYLAMLGWLYTTLRRLARDVRGRGDFPAIILPGLVGVMVAITVAEQFGQYPRLEARVWFISLIIAYAHLLRSETFTEPSAAAKLRAPLHAQAASS